ncbi:MAG: MFS transporter [Ectothiorhodospiraceae bacterium]|nr:MFS transporter [Ectothiorhodospiraceae bacterium]
MPVPAPAAALAARLPFFYGWVVVACACCASIARQGAAVATLSVFVVPMTTELGWSRAGISGAVSLGGVLGAVCAPLVGRLVDRRGAGAVLALSAVAVALAAVALAGTTSLLWFYLAFSVGRMCFAAPFDIGVTAAVAKWFVRRRALAMSIVSLALGIGLALMPVLAEHVIDGHGWRGGWLAIALVVIVVGALPNAVLMVARPEDLGLRPDGDGDPGPATGGAAASPRVVEVEFTVAQAMRTPTAWLLMAYTGVIFAVQAGISLHQAPHLVEQGLTPTAAALVVGSFSLAVALSGLGFGLVGRRCSARAGLFLCAASVAAGAWLMLDVRGAGAAYVAAVLFGTGIGGLHTVVPVAWADYFGRRSYGSLRGVTLPVQVLGQASGPLVAGLLHDASGSYQLSLTTFAFLAAAAAAIGLAARPPAAPG